MVFEIRFSDLKVHITIDVNLPDTKTLLAQLAAMSTKVSEGTTTLESAVKENQV